MANPHTRVNQPYNTSGQFKDLPDPEGQTDTERIAQSIIPYARDDSRARYLGLRASGFTVREALRLIGNAHSTLSAWREQSQFAYLEEHIPDFRKQLSLEYAEIEFIRNYRLVLEKDYRVLTKSLHPDTASDGTRIPMFPQDHDYLIKMRSHYTPQQFQIMESLINADTKQELDFTEFVINIARMKERITVVGKSTTVNSLPAPIPIIDMEAAPNPEVDEVHDT